MLVEGYRFWRFYCTATVGATSELCIGSIRFGNVTFDNAWAASYIAKSGTGPAARAFNNINTHPDGYWLGGSSISPENPTWVGFDRGVGNVFRPTNKMVIQYRPPEYGTSDNDPKNFQLQYSVDGNWWITHYTRTNQAGQSANALIEFALPRLTTYVVSGVIKDVTGSPCSRLIRIYKRSTWELVYTTTSDAVTGYYSYLTGDPSEVAVIVFADDGSDPYLLNDVTMRVLPGKTFEETLDY